MTSFKFTIELTNNIVIWVSLILAIISVVANYLAFHNGLPRQRQVHIFIAIISAFYVFVYIWLLVFTPDPATWAQIMRGFSLLAWVFVWITPALMSVKLWKELHRAVEDRMKEED